MKAKNVVSFLLVLVLILAFAYVAAFDVKIGNIEIKDEVSDVECEKCGRLMVYKQGRFGKFLACPGYPECKNTKTIKTQIAAIIL